jgi:hypothetical protein
VHTLEIPVREILSDIRSGMSDRLLMQKYRLSSKNLGQLFRQLAQHGLLKTNLSQSVLKLDTRDVVKDVLSGKSVPQLMEKYRLNRRTMENLLDHLAKSGVIGIPRHNGEPAVQEHRMAKRHTVDVEIPLQMVEIPSFRGILRDVSEKGIGLLGIYAQPNESARLLILGDDAGDIAPFEVEGICRWSKWEAGQILSGFEITRVSESDLDELLQLIEIARRNEHH